MRRAGAALLLAGFAAACGGEAGEPARPDVLLVTIDTLRADRLGCYGHPRGTSPELDRFAERSAVFEAAQAQTSWTLGSLASLLTSRWVGELGIRDFRSRLEADVATLPEALAAAGYRTAGIGTHVVFQEKYGLRRGLAEFDAGLVEATHEEAHRAVTSERLSDKALAWLERNADGERPWLLWLHYFDPHIPYRRHAGISERFGDAGLDRYDGEVAFTDLHLGRVLRAAERLARPPVVVVTADHGEEFGDHGGREHGHTLYQELVRVPLVVRVPSLPASAGRRIDVPVALVDVAPTVLGLAGVERPAGMVGASLVPLLRGEAALAAPRPILAELDLRRNTAAASVRLGDEKLVLPRDGGAPELYDLARDPGERRDLAARRPERAAALRALLDELTAGHSDEEGHDLELDDEERRVLEDLGYLGDD